MNTILIKFLPTNIRKKVESYKTLSAIFDNIGWLFIDRFLRLTIGLSIGIWVTRYLGPSKFGLLNYAYSYVAIFSTISMLGLNNIIILELVRNPDKKEIILGSAFLLKIFCAIFAIFAACSIEYIIRPDDKLAFFLVLIIASGFIFQTIDVVDYWFQSKILSKYVVWAKAIGLIISSILRVILIISEASVIMFAIVILIDIIIGAIGLLLVYILINGKVQKWKIDFHIIKNLIRDSWPLAISAVAVMIYMKIDQVMIKNFLGDAATGIYSSAVRLAEIWYFIPIIINSTIYPYILKIKKTNIDLYHKRLKSLYELMVIISIFPCIGVYIFSDEIIAVLYGDAYSGAGIILSIYFWACIPFSVSLVASHYILSENFTKIAIFRSTIGCLSNVLLNMLLIPCWGINGAAWATLISYSLISFSIILLKPTRQQGLLLLKSMNIFRIFASLFKEYILKIKYDD